MSGLMTRVTNKVKRVVNQTASKVANSTNGAVVDRFHKIWYDNGDLTWGANTFLGFKIMQSPLDLQLYQEILFKTKPAFILETGVFGGGSLVYFASMLDLMKASPETIVIGVDIVLKPEAKAIQHPRIRLIEGSSTDPAIIEKIKAMLPAPKGMVVLDSDHSEAHVTAELGLYPQFVEVGCYLVVEDTNINGHPVLKDFGPGPMESVRKFLPNHPEFVADDPLWQRNFYSHHQYGWLKRVR
jgi:cephalosporin hydroxylase